MTRKAFGRGLSALLSADKSDSIAEEAFQIDIGLIEPSPFSPGPGLRKALYVAWQTRLSRMDSSSQWWFGAKAPDFN